jgi:hypothetical protein
LEKGIITLSSFAPRIILALAGMAFCRGSRARTAREWNQSDDCGQAGKPWLLADERRSAAHSVFWERGLPGCHQKIAAFQQSTPMYQASVRAAQSDILTNYESLRFQEGVFSTSLKTSREGSTFSVTDGVNTTSLPAVWAFGFKNGQTYILEKDGAYFESRLSFFTKIHSLDITPGHASEAPKDLEAALGRKMDIDRAKACFRCHTTAGFTSKVFEPEKARSGSYL